MGLAMNKVLIISYFFPPVGGGGVIRVTKFVKYLANFGWKPYVLTVQEGFYPIKDPSLLKDIPSDVAITRVRYFEPAFWFKGHFWQSFLAYLVYPLFLIPDRQILWFLAAIVSGYRIIKKEKIKIIFSSFAPASDHLIAMILKKLTGVKWVADFRDEWTNNLEFGFKTVYHRKLAQVLEKKILNNADAIISVSEGLTSNYQRILGKKTHKFTTITNGFDAEDFQNVFFNRTKRKKMSIVHTGTIYGTRTTDAFLEIVKDLNLPLEVEFFGQNKRLPHKDIIRKLYEADILLLILSPKDRSSAMTGKIYEYLAARKPIFALAPKHTGASKLVQKLNVGEVADPENQKEIKEKLLKIYQKWCQNDLKIPEVNLANYERKNLTNNLAEIFNNLTKINRKIKLCLIGNICSPQNQNLCQYFVKKNYEIHFISTKPGKIDGAKTYWLGKNSFTPWYFARSLYKIRKIISQISPDIVHGQDLVFAGIWAYLSGFKPYVVTPWGSDVMNYEKFIGPEKYLIKKTLQRADLVTVSSEALREKAHKIGIPSEKAKLVHFGVDLNIFKKKNVDFLREKYQVGNGQIIFCPRSLAPIYNIDILIKACAPIARRKNITLFLLEQNAENSYLAEIKKLLVRFNLLKSVRFLPRLNPQEMAQIYNLADVVASISSSDGCSVAFLEAMATEKKIVATALPYINEWIFDKTQIKPIGKNLWQVPIMDVQATTEAIVDALGYPISKWQKIGEFNRALIAQNAEMTKNFAKLDQLYRELL